MLFQFFLPVEVFSGVGCVKDHESVFALGKRCFIVTGKHGAKESGALADVCAALEHNGVTWRIYDEIAENPLLSVCRAAGEQARAFGADFTVGIGGGSALDAAKAIACFATNDFFDPMQLFSQEKKNNSLPLILIPTTAGTGSEVNPYSVLTLDGLGKKKTFNSVQSYPKYAFADPSYLKSMPMRGALSCALDAFCHCLESYMSPKRTELSAAIAVLGAKLLWDVLRSATADGWKTLNDGQREALMFGACAGGMAINTTGTGFPHPMGYNLTLDLGVPHGRACGAFTGEYVRCCCETPEGQQRMTAFCAGIETRINELAIRIPELADVGFSLSEEKIESYVNAVCTAGNFKNCVTPIGMDEMFRIYRKLFSQK